jgi:cell division control protein 45
LILSKYEPEPDSDEDEYGDEYEDEEDIRRIEEEADYDHSSPGNKRRSLGDGDPRSGKRRRREEVY